MPSLAIVTVAALAAAAHLSKRGSSARRRPKAGESVEVVIEGSSRSPTAHLMVDGQEAGYFQASKISRLDPEDGDVDEDCLWSVADLRRELGAPDAPVFVAWRSGISREHRGKGYGVLLYEAMLDHLERTHGGPVIMFPERCMLDGGRTSPSAARVWASLERRRVGGEDAISSRVRPRGSASERVWSTEDTAALLRAIEALRGPAWRWAYVSAADNKRALLDAFEALPQDERDAMGRAIQIEWSRAGHEGRRPLFRKASHHEKAGRLDASGISLHPYIPRARPEDVRVFFVAPEEVALDSSVPHPFRDPWYGYFREWDPPEYDRWGRDISRRGRMSVEEIQRFGYSPMHTPQYDYEMEIVLKRGVNPPQMSLNEFLELDISADYRRSAGSLSRAAKPAR